MTNLDTLRNTFNELYPVVNQEILELFIDELIQSKSRIPVKESKPDWYKDAVVYSLYVDLFNKDFTGLIQKLPYLQQLGVNCLWLLPILDSPMRDAGFDIRNYDRIRKELFGLPENAGIEEERSLFRAFLASAHQHGIRVIFDIAMNHTSNTNPWFIEASKGEGSPYDDFFIWNEDTNKYKETRLLFKGMCPSNWEKEGDMYYFHRFFEFQPDLNYHNPQVLLTMGRILLFWLSQGVDGFRADAIPYIWKTEGTDCENLPEAHLIIRFWRAMLDFIKPGTLLLAEACQPPKEVVKYFGEENECHAGYHFPLMPQLFIALGQGKAEPIINILSEEITPKIPQSCQWFTFLRCHDELTLEMVTPEERNIMNGLYRHQDRWNFREGEGIAARLSELMKFDHRKVLLAYSMMLTLPGTPVIYYGDEYGKSNDEAYYNQQVSATGYTDSRYFVRGPVDWNEVEAAMAAPDSFGGIVFYGLKQMLHERRQSGAFSRGNLTFKTLMNEKGQECTSVLAFEREFEQDRILVIHNLSGKQQTLDLSDYNFKASVGLLTNLPLSDGNLLLEPYSYHWVRL